MRSRREFLKTGAAAAAAASVPWAESLLASDQPRMGTRVIPGTNEKLPIVGLGNAAAFHDPDMELSRQLISILTDRGGSYIDTTGRSRFTVASIMQERDAHDRIFPGTYVAPTDDAEIRREIAAVRDAQGSTGPLDLVLTRNIGAYASAPDRYLGLREDGLTRYVGVARHQQRYHETMVDLGVAVLINRPFINGEYFSIVRGQTLPEWAADFDCQSWAQFAVKWILGNAAVNCVLTETSNPRHAVDNVSAGIGRLPDAETRRRMQRLIQELA
jgi:diketogulonate reductase-like aldo/keto reductase